jgi:hypothetical protein
LCGSYDAIGRLNWESRGRDGYLREEHMERYLWASVAGGVIVLLWYFVKSWLRIVIILSVIAICAYFAFQFIGGWGVIICGLGFLIVAAFTTSIEDEERRWKRGYAALQRKLAWKALAEKRAKEEAEKQKANPAPKVAPRYDQGEGTMYGARGEDLNR